jgi:hypothetical protein
MGRVEVATKELVSKWMAKEPGMNINLLWQQAQKRIKGDPINYSWCSNRLAMLLAISKVGFWPQ